MSAPALKVEGLSKSFEMAGTLLPVLRGIDLEVAVGERVAIVGQSGSGKSTFLHVVGTLDHPCEGRVFLDGVDAFAHRASELDRLRNRHIGFVFQFHHLLPDQDAVHNVMIPALIGGAPRDEARERAESLLIRVGLQDRMVHRPGELSGGEQQRVALARALVQKPRLLLADEPTGNLDPATAAHMLDLMLELNEEQDTTLIVVTHSVALAQRFPRQLSLVAGRFQEQSCA
jgi:lipoprotein-releasing system ATP-binding protein